MRYKLANQSLTAGSGLLFALREDLTEYNTVGVLPKSSDWPEFESPKLNCVEMVGSERMGVCVVWRRHYISVTAPYSLSPKPDCLD